MNEIDEKRQGRGIYVTDFNYNPKRIPQGFLKFHCLLHSKIGGCTNFCILIGGLYDIIPKVFTNLRRNLGDFIDYGLRPESINAPTFFVRTSGLISVGLTKSVMEYNTRFSKTGLGYRTLTVPELGKIYGFTERHRTLKLTIDTFPIVPIDILHSAMRVALVGDSSKGRSIKILTPQVNDIGRSDSERVYLPDLKKFLPPTWAQESTESLASTKNNDAKTVMNLWNLRIIPLF